MFRYGLAFALCVAATAVADQDSDGIAVTGQGTINAPPDLFELAVGVSAQDLDLDKARQEVARRSAKVTATAKSFPLDRARSFTTGFSIRPNYNYERFLGYTVYLSMR